MTHGGTLLGTPLLALPDREQPALLASDLHVPAGGGPVVAALVALLSLAAQRRARVFLLGDLFDSYVVPAQLRTGVHRQVAEHLAQAVAAGVEVFVLRGNRDFLLGPELAAQTGAVLAPGGFRVRLGGLDTALVHGDELCTRDLPYQRAKRWLRRPWLGACLRRLPLRLAQAAAERARAKSRKVVQQGDPERFLPPAEALRTALATGVQQVVFGHIHRAAAGRVGGGRYRVLPAFDATGGALWAGPEGWRPVVVDPGRGLIDAPEPPPLPLAEAPPGWPGTAPG
jgi:UDP-2,3-diacylglucosamine hydrolase